MVATNFQHAAGGNGMSDNDNRFDFSAIDTLMSATDHDYQNFDILGAKVPLRPVTVLQSVRSVKRFPALLELFEPKVDPKTGKVLPEHMQPSVFAVIANAGSEASAAWVACSAGREGDAKFEADYAAAPDKLALPLFVGACKITFGEEDPRIFFGKVTEALKDAGILKEPPVSKAA
jgi:hypothetical protein